MNREPEKIMNLNATGSYSPVSASEEDVTDSKVELGRPPVPADHSTSIAAADSVVASRSAETVGVSLDPSRHSRARVAPRFGASPPGRRGGAGGTNRQTPMAVSCGRGWNSAGIATLNSAGAAVRKSSSCTAQSEKLRLDYTFEKPSFSADAFPSLYDELLRSFEEEENPHTAGIPADASNELAFILSAVLNEEHERDVALPENLLHRMFAGSGRQTQLRSPAATHSSLEKKPCSAAVVRDSPASASETPRTFEGQGASNTSLHTYSDSDLQMQPRPPKQPVGDILSPRVSEICLLPSTSASLNTPFLSARESPSKQNDTSDGSGQTSILFETDQKMCKFAYVQTKEDNRNEWIHTVSNPTYVTPVQAEEEKCRQIQNHCIPENTDEPEMTRLSPDPKVLSFALLSEVYKEQSEPKYCHGAKIDDLIERKIREGNNQPPTHGLSPPLVAKTDEDRIRSDKRIPLPEEILLAINRAIKHGELKAQGDADTFKTCSRALSDTGVCAVSSHRESQSNKSSKFLQDEQATLSALQPFSYFKLSSTDSGNSDLKILSGTDLGMVRNALQVRSEECINYDDMPLARPSTHGHIRRGPLYRKTCERAEGKLANDKKGIVGSESLTESLSTPPNSPVRSKAGISFSDPIATCVTDCNTNMANSGSTENFHSCGENLEIKTRESCPEKTVEEAREGVGGDHAGKDGIPVACSTAGGAGDREEANPKLELDEKQTSTTTESPRGARLCTYPPLKPTLNSHPSILLKPQEYLDFYAFLKNKKPVKKEVRRPKTKIFKLQRMMTDIKSDVRAAHLSPDPEDSEMNSKPIFPRGREVPPGWKPGQHGSHPITQISAEYEMAAHHSSKSKKHAWRKNKIRRKAVRYRESSHGVKQSASETSEIVSPQPVLKKRSMRRGGQDSTDDMALVTNSEFERKRQFYERQQRSKAAHESSAGKSGKRNKPKKVTEQVKFLKTIDDICNAEEGEEGEEYEENLMKTLEGNDDSLMGCNDKDYQLHSSLAKYYIGKLQKSATKKDASEADDSLNSFQGVRISRGKLQVPSTISQDRLRAIRPTPPQGASGHSLRWPSRAHHSHPNLPATSAKWPESSLDILGAQSFKKNPRKLYKTTSEWISASKVGVNSDYREAWDQLRANYVEAKSETPQHTGDVRTESKKKEAREESKRSSEKSEKVSSPKKTPAAKLIAGLKEKSTNYKLKQVTKLPAPPDRSEEDTWCYSVNAMLLKAKQVMADSQKKGTHRFPRHNSAAVVSPVIDQRATSNFLKTLLKQDAEELRQSKLSTPANNEAGIKQQRERIRSALNKSTAKKNTSSGKTINNSCNIDPLSPTEGYVCEENPVTFGKKTRSHPKQFGGVADLHETPTPGQTDSTASRIKRPRDNRLPGKRHKTKNQKVKTSPRKPTIPTITGSNYILDQTLHYYEYPFITDSSIVPLYGNTNSNALSEDHLADSFSKVEEQTSLVPVRKHESSLEDVDNPALRRSDTLFDADHSGCPKMRTKCTSNASVSVNNLSFTYFSSNNNAIPVHQNKVGTKILPILRPKFECVGTDKLNCKSSPFSTIGALNKADFLESLFDLEKKTRNSKQSSLSRKRTNCTSLFKAKAKADAAFESFLVQTKQKETDTVDKNFDTNNPSGATVECFNFPENYENFDRQAPPSNAKQMSKTDESSTGTENGILNATERCAKDNKILNKPSETKKTKLYKNVFKHGSFSIGQPRCVEKAQPPVSVGSPQKSGEVSKGISVVQQNYFLKDRITGAVTNIENRQSYVQLNKEYITTEIGKGRNTTDVFSSRKYSKAETSYLYPCENIHFANNETKRIASNNSLDEKSIVPATSDHHISMNENQDSHKDLYLNGSQEDYVCESSKSNVHEDTATGVKDCSNAPCHKSPELPTQSGSANDSSNLNKSVHIINGTEVNKEETFCRVEAEKTEPIFTTDMYVSQTAKVYTDIPHLGHLTNDFKRSNNGIGTNSSRDCGAENLNDATSDCSEDDNGTEFTSARCTSQAVNLTAFDRTEHCLEEPQIYDNNLDPDYMNVSGCDILKQENGNDAITESEHSYRTDHSEEMLCGFKHYMSSSETSISLPPMEMVDSENSELSEGKVSAPVPGCKKSEEPCPDGAFGSDYDRLACRSSCIANRPSDEEFSISASEIDFNDPENQRFGKDSLEPSIQPRADVPITVSTAENVSVEKMEVCASLNSAPPSRDVSQKVNTTKSEGVLHCRPLETTQAGDCKETESARVNNDLVESHGLVRSRREIVSAIPPPPSPSSNRMTQGYYRNYLSSHVLSDIANKLLKRRKELLAGLNATVMTFFYVPVFRLNDYQVYNATAAVLKVCICSQDKDDYRLLKATPFTVFYREDENGVPACVYAVQWFGRGLYSLENRDIINDNEHLGVIKLGALCEHSLQSGALPPSFEHYPLLLIGAPSHTKDTALKEANIACSMAKKKGQISPAVNLFLGVTPWWTLSRQGNRFAGPNNLSSCVTTKRCGAEEKFGFNDQHLREMMFKDVDISYLVKSFQCVASESFSNTASVQPTGFRHAARSVQVKSERRWNAKKNTQGSEFPCNVPICGRAIPVISFPYDKKDNSVGSNRARLPHIKMDTRTQACVEASPLHQNSSKIQSKVRGPDAEWAGEKETPARCRIPSGTPPASARDDTTAELKGDHLRGWEWSQTVLPPPFPDTLRRTKRRKKIILDRRSTKARGRSSGRRRMRRQRSASSSLKSYSSAPSTSSSSIGEGEGPSLKEIMLKCSREGYKPQSLDDIFSKVLPQPKIPYNVKKLLEAREKQETEEAGEEQRILNDAGAGGDTNKALPGAAAVSGVAASPMTTPTPRQSSLDGRTSEYDMMSDEDDVRESWANCFPEVHYSEKTKRWSKTKHARRSTLYAKAAVVMGLGSLL
ncbi:hypothetical protein ElyMa_006030100 [Elysia marginata]|uniref:Uncharacterized protein n=1 Tax=Elysia marginata TaxID=1093978 RepID=A0AAV4GIG4_9GAST|nr:hypothetical protein ElyMa_006030100 [Elysia marginata]